MDKPHPFEIDVARNVDDLGVSRFRWSIYRYKVERWDWRDVHVEEIVASASLVMVGRAAFHAPVDG